MAGNKSRKKSYFSLFSIFRFKRSRWGGDEAWDDSMKAYKVYPSDQDRAGRWADPRIDSKASAYIDDRTNKWNNVEIKCSEKIQEQFALHWLINLEHPRPRIAREVDLVILQSFLQVASFFSCMRSIFPRTFV
ncbi:hypothetical protein L1887_38846 [Cichorium endivia]|nr:hypothetical protein L1887_38846 [Cichorium endivia]